MSEASTNGTNLLDPLGIWKTARDTNLEIWSKMMVDLVNTDEYAQATGAALEQALATSQPFRDALERNMTQTLALMNMPSRAEVVNVAERLVNVEMRLDDMDAKLSDIHKSLREAIKETGREASAAPERNAKDLRVDLAKVNSKLEALLKAVGKVNKPQPEKPVRERKSPVTEKAEEGRS
jgi:polyhydroxyalkanoic acid synthase PhaR subunit